ncbi:hypothetical protein CXB77_18840 [Chromatium okenii]|uniref:Uncharacterized protein n=4 Tax=Chromatium okenii TaxID=61644 RepID=A0A2S7XLU6_9GAMM|nr:hypothetical protein CXB77_18840 [Chromatium okenii]
MKDERKMMSFRLPIEARDRMQRLMSIHNAPSQADVILMALDALESVAPAPAVSAQLDDVVTRIDKMFEDVLNQLAAMQASFAEFEARLSAIEAGAVSELTSVKEVSLDVRLVAVAMKAAKKTNEEIQAYIGNATGKRFSFSFKQNLSNNLENWKRAADKQL